MIDLTILKPCVPRKIDLFYFYVIATISDIKASTCIRKRIGRRCDTLPGCHLQTSRGQWQPEHMQQVQ